MSALTREQITEQFNAKSAEVNAFYAKYPNDADVPVEEAQRLNAELVDIGGKMKDFITAAELRKASRAQIEAMGGGEEKQERKEAPAGGGKVVSLDAHRAGKSFGEQFLADDQFKSWFKTMAPNGRLTEKAPFTSPRVGIETKIITGASSTSAGAMTVPDQVAGIVGALRRPLTIRDIITVLPTANDSIEYVKRDTETNNAAPVAEATATSGSSGTKPQSDFTLARVTDTVKTIAHWVAVTTRALADAPQIRAIIDEFLLYGLQEELEDQIVAGDGTGENLTGIANISGVQAQAWDTDLITTALKARDLVRTVGRDRANAYLMNPADIQRYQLLQDNNGGFYFGGPAGDVQLRIWGLPVIDSEAVPAGTGYVGNFRRLVLYDREEAGIQASNSHSDFFIRNLVAVLAELRAGLGLWQPKSIVEIDLTA